jgi:hypothetical protein
MAKVNVIKVDLKNKTLEEIEMDGEELFEKQFKDGHLCSRVGSCVGVSFYESNGKVLAIVDNKHVLLELNDPKKFRCKLCGEVIEGPSIEVMKHHHQLKAHYREVELLEYLHHYVEEVK